MTATQLAICGLATCQAIDIWRSSSLLATTRARLEARGGKLAELAGCRLCLSFWVAIAAAGFAVHGGDAGRAVLAVLAVGKLSRLAHDWSKDEDGVFPLVPGRVPPKSTEGSEDLPGEAGSAVSRGMTGSVPSFSGPAIPEVDRGSPRQPEPMPPILRADVPGAAGHAVIPNVTGVLWNSRDVL